jgi:hypothetical protein
MTGRKRTTLVLSAVLFGWVLFLPRLARLPDIGWLKALPWVRTGVLWLLLWRRARRSATFTSTHPLS